jgi:hypothetical protein
VGGPICPIAGSPVLTAINRTGSSDVDKAFALTFRETAGQGTLKNLGKPKFVVDSFKLHCVLLTEGSVVDPSRDTLELTKLITTDGPAYQVRLGRLQVI